MHTSNSNYNAYPFKKTKSNLFDRQMLQKLTILNNQQLYHRIHSHSYNLNRENNANNNKVQDNSLTTTELFLKIYSLIRDNVYSADRKKYYEFVSVYYCNLAYAKLKEEDIEASSAAIEEAINSLEHLRGFLSNREQIIAYNQQLAKLYLQYCALLSQLDQHKTAASYAEKSLSKTIQTIRILSVLCEEQLITENISHLQSNSSTQQSKQAERTAQTIFNIEKVHFKNAALLQSKQILNQLSLILAEHKPLSKQSKLHYTKIIKQLYYWKDNDEINKQWMRKKLSRKKDNQDSIYHSLRNSQHNFSQRSNNDISSKSYNQKLQKRNLLGVSNKYSSSICKFNMSSIMSLKFHRLNDFFLTVDRMVLLSPEKIKQLALMTSVSYFIIATQNRFYEFKQDISSMKIAQKYKQLSSNQNIQKSKILHLRALQIATNIVEEAQTYFQHLVRSFNKNYKTILDQIEEEKSINMELVATKECPTNFQLQQAEASEATVEYGIALPKQYRKTRNNNGLKKVKSWQFLPSLTTK